jgi:hypothetical protein
MDNFGYVTQGLAFELTTVIFELPLLFFVSSKKYALQFELLVVIKLQLVWALFASANYIPIHMMGAIQI